jgi:tetratricopeptide (TPR) repeat protein
MMPITNRFLAVVLAIHLFWPLNLLAQVETDSRIKSLTESLRIEKNDSLRASYSKELAQLYAVTDYLRAGDFAERAVDYAMRTKSLYLQSDCLNNAAEIYLNAGQNEIAVDYFHQNIALAKRAGNVQLQAIAEFNLGSVWLIAGQFQKAETLMRRLEESGDHLDTASRISLYNNLIILNNDKKDPLACRRYFDLGLSMAGSNNAYQSLKGQLYSNYGDALAAFNQYEEAINNIDTALMIFEAIGDYGRIGSCLYDLGEMFLIQGKSNEALNFFRRTFDLGGQTNNDHLVRISAQALYEHYKQSPKVDSCLKYLSIASETNIRLVELATKDKLNSQELRWRYEAQQERDKKRYQQKILTAITVSLVVIVFLMWRIYSRQQQMKLIALEKNTIELNARNLQLENELLTAEVALKDKQLTTEVLYRIQNNEQVRDMVQKLLNINMLSGKDTKEALTTVVKGLENTLEEKAWEDFELRFQQVYPGFYEKLQEVYPDLTLNERRLSAFLKLNMTTKEISSITGQNLSAIQMARWRLRKKLGLQETESALADFFSKF